jgi:hypothetical protein
MDEGKDIVGLNNQHYKRLLANETDPHERKASISNSPSNGAEHGEDRRVLSSFWPHRG